MSFSELRKLNRFISTAPDFVKIVELNHVDSADGKLPIYGIQIGPDDKSLPTTGLFGGVHGIEKIGSHVVINHLKYLCKQLEWDESLQDIFRRSRLVSIPIVNPWGMKYEKRSNPNGVDLMRNAPVDAEGVKPWALVSGQNYSSRLPWFRGTPYKSMELESQTLVDFVREEMFGAEFSIALDVHSGFGLKDHLWFPYSKTSESFPLQGEVNKIVKNFEASMPHNHYVIEPQSQAYRIHGDLWDYMFDLHYSENKDAKTFLPWTLELGSWMWLRKNPAQAFKFKGFFNPILPHRYDRIMRRHRFLIEFLHKTAISHENWSK